MEIPLQDTPTPKVFELGFGGKADQAAVADCMRLLRVSKKLLGHFLLRFTDADLSPGKYSVMMELLSQGERGSLMPSELAARIGVTRPTITGLVDGLVKQKLVVRRASQTDRRKMTIALSEKGRQRMSDLLPGQFDAMADVVSPLTRKERAELARLLQKIEGGLHG